MDDPPTPGSYRGNASPSRSRLQVTAAQLSLEGGSVSRRHAVSLVDPQTQHSLDSRRSSVSSLSSASWANTTAAGATPVPGIIAPSPHRGKLIYTPMILLDEVTGSSRPLWSDGSASLPAGSRPGWYPGQSQTFTSMRAAPASRGFVDRGSADSLVESVRCWITNHFSLNVSLQRAERNRYFKNKKVTNCVT